MGAYSSRDKLPSAQIRGHFQNVGLSRPISPYFPRWELIFPEISSHWRRSADIPRMSAYLGQCPGTGCGTGCPGDEVPPGWVPGDGCQALRLWGDVCTRRGG